MSHAICAEELRRHTAPCAATTYATAEHMMLLAASVPGGMPHCLNPICPHMVGCERWTRAEPHGFHMPRHNHAPFHTAPALAFPSPLLPLRRQAGGLSACHLPKVRRAAGQAQYVMCMSRPPDGQSEGRAAAWQHDKPAVSAILPHWQLNPTSSALVVPATAPAQLPP